MDVLSELWTRLWTPMPVVSPAAGLVAVVVGVVIACLPGRVWRAARHVITLIHEAGHALVGLLTGRRLAGIRLHTDTSGVTTTVGAERGLGRLLTTLAGYTGPPAFAALLVVTVVRGHAGTAMFVLVTVTVGLLLATRNMWGWFITVSVLAVMVGVLYVAPPLWLQLVLLTVAGFAATGGVRSFVEERGARRAGGVTDVVALADRSVWPAGVWAGVMWVLIAGWVALPVWVLLLR